VAILVAGMCGLVGLGVVLAVTRDTGGPTTRVLGEQVERSTTTTPAATTSSSVAAVGSTTTTTRPPSAASHPSTTTSVPPPVKEQSDNVVSIDYRAAGGSAKASSERVPSNPPPADPLRFELVLGDPAPDGTIAVRADLTDQTTRPVRFPGGLEVSVVIARDGQPWRTLSLRRPEVTELAAHAVVSVTGSVVLDADGHYELGGSTVVQYA